MAKDYSKLVKYEWGFGDDKALADRLKVLVLSGKKTATTGLYRKNKKIPAVGDYGAILDGDKKRFCIIRYTKVRVEPFLDVGYGYAKKEGEGYETIEQWRDAHRKFFKSWRSGFKDSSLVVCEEFNVVQKIN